MEIFMLSKRHKVLTLEGWKEYCDLEEGDVLITDKGEYTLNKVISPKKAKAKVLRKGK